MEGLYNLSGSDIKTSKPSKGLWQDTVPLFYITHRMTDMVTSGIMKMLHEAIRIYDKLCGRNYLIVFGSKNKYKFIQLTIRQSNFWHLLGCSLDSDTNDGKRITYLKCRNQEDVSDKILSDRSFSEISEKYTAMKNVFNFIAKASEIKISYATNCPEEHLFTIGTGNDSGVIGYDYPNDGSSDLLFPKSAQLKSISKISQRPDRVLMIMSKEIMEKHYNKMEYEIKKNAHSEILKHIPETIKVSINTQT